VDVIRSPDILSPGVPLPGAPDLPESIGESKMSDNNRLFDDVTDEQVLQAMDGIKEYSRRRRECYEARRLVLKPLLQFLEDYQDFGGDEDAMMLFWEDFLGVVREITTHKVVEENLLAMLPYALREEVDPD